MRVIVVLSLALLASCSGHTLKKQKNIQQMIREVRHLDKTLLIDVYASVRERRSDDITGVVFSDFQCSPKTKFGYMEFDKKGLKAIRYDRWKGPRMNTRTLNMIKHCLCEIGIESIKVDSCGNTSFTLYNENSYFIVKNRECLTARDTLNHNMLK